ncbi:DUF3679 domain-containing protein [Bacillus fonticola]|uniref:DUF3679 domain-containing protein n=1 Tax=Bacillus fonticola TaxID=2728853 RepID=UPI001474014B|nr:DUF3679 domain-containing protein [Bacillus fonticola]
MVRFSLKVFVTICVLFLGVLIGYQQATTGLENMRGFDDPDISPPVDVVATSEGEYEASWFGNSISSHDLDSKQQKLEDMETYNFFSELGQIVASVTTVITDWLFSLLANLLP